MSMSNVTPKHDWRHWQGRICNVWQKCVENIIDTGRLLIAAKDELKHGSFETMVQSELPFGPDTAQRLMVIARHPILSNAAHAPLLPPSWMTLYELTKLDDKLGDGTLQKKIKDGSITPRLERKDVVAMTRAADAEAERARLERRAAKETEKARRRLEFECSPAAAWREEERRRKAEQDAEDAEELERLREEKRAAAARAAGDVGASEIERKLARLQELENRNAALERAKIALNRENEELRAAMVDLIGDPAAVAARLCVALGDRAEMVAKAMLLRLTQLGPPVAELATAHEEEANAKEQGTAGVDHPTFLPSGALSARSASTGGGANQ
jgi:hypothetical protein